MTSASSVAHPASRAAILGTTLVLGVSGVALIFAPAEIAAAAAAPVLSPVPLLLQLYGAALFGLAMSGWMVKDSIVGGVFGRSYVVGNSAHAITGALLVIRPAIATGASPALRAVAGVYWLLAILFGYLLFAASPRT